MSAVEWESWLSDLDEGMEKEKWLSSQLRNGGKVSQLSSKVRELQKLVTSLDQSFKKLEPKTSAFTVLPDELTRRKMLLDQLKHDQTVIQEEFNSQNSKFKSKGKAKTKDTTRSLLGLQTQMMKDQDTQLEDISKGVSNLHNYSLSMHDESHLHIKLLNDIDGDVDRANVGLESEGDRAAQVAKTSSNTRLYLTIMILVLILLFLLIVGG